MQGIEESQRSSIFDGVDAVGWKRNQGLKSMKWLVLASV